MTRVNLDAFDQYVIAGFTLLPLHLWGAKSSYKGKEREDGKRPLHKDWTKRPYQSSMAIDLAADEGNNVGVRLTAEQLVIDVDPRNMPKGRDTFKELCKAINLEPSDYPTVNTGSGGLHIYMRKDADVPVMDTVEGYPGVEFKTKGRQVVAAGSVHPNGNLYAWDEFAPNLVDAEDAPEALMSLIKRPERSSIYTASEGGEHDQEEIAEMLEHIDPTVFADGGDVDGIDWLKFMMAIHHASGGEARDEFIEWSTRDPKYADDGWIIGRRWDSLHRKGPDGFEVTRNTLYHILRQQGHEDAVPAKTSEAQDDFDDDFDLGDFGDDQDDTPAHERKGPLARLNEKYCTVMLGGKFRIAQEVYDEGLDRKSLEFSTEADFKSWLRNRKIEKVNEKGEPKSVPIADEWLAWGKRRGYEGIVFDPQEKVKGRLNLWTGFGVEPAPEDLEIGRSWSLMKELIYEGLCAGNEELGDFVINWCAKMVQKPWEPGGVAICFRGDQGVGKSTLGSALVHLCGRHGLQLTNQKHITGSFNSHLMETVFLFADEAIAPTNREAQSAMKALITERSLMIEPKGVNAFMSRSCLHVMMASNYHWFINASAEGKERRYCVSEVSNKYQQDTKFFSALNEQLYEKGGLQVMLHDLLARDVSGWVAEANIPKTNALVEQKIRNLEPIGKWWFNALDNGIFPVEPTVEGVDWHQSFVKGFVEELKDSFADFCRENRISPGSMGRDMDRVFWGTLREMCEGISIKNMSDKIPEDRFVKPVGQSGVNATRARVRIFPSLADCREQFEKFLGDEKVNWATEVDAPDESWLQ